MSPSPTFATSSTRARRRALLLTSACLAAAGCFETRVGEPDAGMIDDDRDAAESSEPDAADPPPELPDAGGGEDAAVDRGPVSCRTPDVDLLFVIDNSGSMAEEQQKLASRLPGLLAILATGNRDGKRSVEGEPTDFEPARTIHVGVVSTDLGLNLAPDIESCGGASYSAVAPDPANPTPSVRMTAPNGVRLNKPFGDDGQLQTSTEVAEAGIWARPSGTTFSTSVELRVAPDPSCADVRPDRPFLEYGPGDLFEDTQHAFSCIAKLGKNGCGLEQQLESMLKALSPATVTFSRNTRGQGSASGLNAGFLREDAILVVVIVSDEEDCSIPDESSDLFNRYSPNFAAGDLDTRCGKRENQHYLHPVARYVEGLRALKSAADQGRIIVASITGLPLAEDLDGSAVHRGSDLDAILERPDMQFTVRPAESSSSIEAPVPTCTSGRGDGTATPGRRFLELARAFGENGIASSICEDDYGAMVDVLSERIARHLGVCE